MILDSVDQIEKIDLSDMYGAIYGLPEQLKKAWELGNSLLLPNFEPVTQILIAGMGGSAIGGDLLANYVADLADVPVIVHRDYALPAWAKGKKTLVIASSHSGNTEETLSAYEQAKKNGCQLFCLTTGGKLAKKAQEDDTACWQFDHKGQPRAAVGFSFGILLALFSRLGWISNQSTALLETVEGMNELRQSCAVEIGTTKNPAKRLAGQLQNRWVAVFGSGMLAPVARRWKGQISEVSKAWAQFEFLPEANHNTLAGLINPEEVISATMALFLKSKFDHERNQIRTELTRKYFMLEGLNTDLVEAKGEHPLVQMWTTLLFGDFVAFYLAMLYGVDPTPVEMLQNFKKELQ
jgi:glucose/mannose-6-phosphate isomerase